MKINVQAHRGASAYAPENTLPAFELAIEMQADGVENDIRMTKDGIYVVSHNSTIQECSTGEGRVEYMTLEELRQYDFGIKKSEKFKGTPIPTLHEFLEVVKNMNVINIEMKPLEPCVDRAHAYKYIYESVKEYECLERVIVSSFDHVALKELKEAYPDIKTALLYTNKMTDKETLEFVKQYKADAIHPVHTVLTHDIAKACKDNNIMINAWTVDCENDVLKCIDMGVTGIITNVPDVVLKILQNNNAHE